MKSKNKLLISATIFGLALAFTTTFSFTPKVNGLQQLKANAQGSCVESPCDVCSSWNDGSVHYAKKWQWSGSNDQ